MSLIEKVNAEVLAERYRQDQKWGVQRHDYGGWLMILMEEVGEVAEAMMKQRGWGKETDAENLYQKLIQVAAVASAIAEQVLESKSE